MKRTTVFADEELLNGLKRIADEEGIPVAEAIRQALDRFVTQRRKPKKISFLGIGRSGRKDVAKRSEELLWNKPPADAGKEA